MAHAPDPDAALRPYGARATRRAAWTGLDRSALMGMELLAAILTWGAIGWFVDRWLGTAPWLFGVGTMVGFAAGLYLVWLRSGRDQERDVAARDHGGVVGG
jgi:ATP synthase protein I